MMKFTTIMQIAETVCTAGMVAVVFGSIDFAGSHQVAVIASIVGAHLLGIVSGMAFCYRRQAKMAMAQENEHGKNR